MAVLTVTARNGPLGRSNPPDDTVEITLLPAPGQHGVTTWIQNYRPTWKTEWWTTIRY